MCYEKRPRADAIRRGLISSEGVTTETMASITQFSDRGEIKSRAKLAEVCEALGIERRGRMWRCFVHEDETPSAHIHRERFHCFGCGFRGDVFEVVGARLGFGFKDSLRWLADFYHVPLNEKPLTKQERQTFARAQREATAEAEQLAAWRRGLVDALRSERNAIWEGEQTACRWARAHLGEEYADDPRWELVWSAVKRQELGDRCNRALNTIEGAPAAALLRFWKSREQEAA
jgi:hypothetical protein